VLGSVELLCCEDTRRTGVLLRHCGLRVPRLAVCNEHTETRCLADVLTTLEAGRDVALVSDAGTPAVSDPGERLVRAIHDAGYVVSSVPGPSAAIMALTISGFSTARFVFEGFLPRKGRERTDRLASLSREERTMVLYEAPHRVERTLSDLRAALGDDRMVAVARELTKLH
jgi:16S rRNA (cytidine1402-2'-O)-methyltransferase